MSKHNWKYIDVATLDFDDAPTWDLICRGETAGLFQIEGQGMTDACIRIQPRKMEDLIALIALYRPDTMRELEHFIKRKNGEEEITYIHPDLEPILKTTYGCLVYQEQIMAITKVFAGFSNAEADKFRKGIGKKNKVLVKEQAEKFYKRCIEKGYSEEVAKALTEILEEMGGYSFNKGHSAGYAITVFKTAYLKANHSVMYMCSLLSNQKKEKGSTDYEGIAIYLVKCKEMGIVIKQPNANLAQPRFSVADGEIIYGLRLVKGMSKNAVKHILETRPYSSFEDFLEKCQGKGDINKTNIIALIKSGAFDYTGRTREELLWMYQDYRFKNKLDAISPVEQINKTHIEKMLTANKIRNNETTDRDFCLGIWNKWRLALHKEDWEENYMSGDIFTWEYDSICYHLSGDPFEGVQLPLWGDYEDEDNNAKVGGTLIAIKKTKIKKGKQVGKQMAFLTVSNKEGTRDITVFADGYEKFQEQLVKGANMIFRGKKQGEGLILNGLRSLEDYKLYEM